jgi:translation initiation factor 2 subunit 3
MAGKIAGHTGTLTKSVKIVNMEVHLLDRAVGSEEELEIKPLSKHEPLMLNIGTSTNVGVVQSGKKKGQYEFKLKFPACVENGSRITIARRYGSRWRLIGYGIVR